MVGCAVPTAVPLLGAPRFDKVPLDSHLDSLPVHLALTCFVSSLHPLRRLLPVSALHEVLLFERETVYTALTDCGLPEDGSVELEAFILTLIRLVRRVQTSDGAAG